ncbi:MAG: subclass B3 metallo-beta-lactamase [Gemmatimonadales bacterium]
MRRSSFLGRLLSLAIGLVPAAAAAQNGAAGPRVGPPRGTVVVVGGGQIGPRVWAEFIEAAGGPDALIIDVPTAGGDSAYPPDWRGRDALLRAGAKNVVVLHTIDRKVADSDSFAAIVQRAGGVWFEGGRQWHLVDSYAGTRTEQAFHGVLARGGVVGGSSAGASILASYLLRGARSGNAIVMDPEYDTGFGFLRGTAIDQHVVARDRLPDLADSLIPRRPDLLGISEDEGTAWVVRGDTATIVGRNKAFVYGAPERDAGVPFLTLLPGDRFDLGARRLLSRAGDRARLSGPFLDSIVAPASGRAQILVARAGEVLGARTSGIPVQPSYLPATAVGLPLGALGDAFWNLARQLAPDSAAGRRDFLNRRIFTPLGIRRTAVDSARPFGAVTAGVDDLYRLELGLSFPDGFQRDGAGTIDPAAGWVPVSTASGPGVMLTATNAGRRGAYLRIPAAGVAVIILTEDDRFDARAAALAVAARLDPFARDALTPLDCRSCPEWNRGHEPVRVFGNAYYVGTEGLGAMLITSSQGHILIDGALPQSAPLIAASIAALGFRLGDVRLILNSHPHYDHAGGIAPLARASGAAVRASARAANVIRTGRSEADDPQFGGHLPFEGVPTVTAFAPGDTLRIGPLAIVPVATPGHTPGGTSWTWRSCEGDRCLDLVYADSQSPISDPDFRYSANSAFPDAVPAFEAGLARLERLRCDVIVTPHPGASGFWERVAARTAGNPEALVDPEGCRKYAAQGRAALARRLASERLQR